MTRRYWRGSAEYTDMGGEEGKSYKGERIWAICSVGKGTRVNLGGLGKGKGGYHNRH